MLTCAKENIVALCDVDHTFAAKTFKAFPNAKVYKDYRVMLEKQKDIDAVLIATPDHTHAVISMAAHAIRQARLLPETAHPRHLRIAHAGQGGEGSGRRHADGHPGTFRRRACA